MDKFDPFWTSLIHFGQVSSILDKFHRFWTSLFVARYPQGNLLLQRLAPGGGTPPPLRGRFATLIGKVAGATILAALSQFNPNTNNSCTLIPLIAEHGGVGRRSLKSSRSFVIDPTTAGRGHFDLLAFPPAMERSHTSPRGHIGQEC